MRKIPVTIPHTISIHFGLDDLGNRGLGCLHWVELGTAVEPKQISSGEPCRAKRKAAPWQRRLKFDPILFDSFSGTLSRQSLLDALLLARLQVEGVTPDLLDDVFLLHFAFEATKRIPRRLALLQSDFCQSHHLPTSTQLHTLNFT